MDRPATSEEPNASGLKRVLGPLDAGWLVAGNMIGAGIFYTPGLVAGHLPGLAWPLVAWLLGGALALSGAAVYAELGARLPRAGGDYQFLTVAFGPAWGFLTGWAAILLTFTAAAAAMSIVASSYAGTALNVSINPFVVAPLIVLSLTLANVLGARLAGRTTALFTGIPLAGLLVLFGAGLFTGQTEVQVPKATGFEGAWPLALGAAMLPVYFTYSGWNAAAYVAGEVRDPQRNLARGLLGGTALVTLIYMTINFVFLIVVPQDQLAGSTTAGSQAARMLLGPAGERALAGLIAVAVLGSVNVTLMAGSRVYFAMARDGLLPEPLGRTNAAGSPSWALWTGGIWSALLAMTGRVDTLVNWASLAILLLSSLAVASLFVLRRRGGDVAYRCPGYPWTPAIYLTVSLAVAAASTWSNPMQSLYGVLIVGAGFPIYALIRRAARA